MWFSSTEQAERHRRAVCGRQHPFAFSAKAADAAAASLDAAVTPVVIVTGSRTEHARADFPAAIGIADARQIRDMHMRVNASESLIAVPGLVIHHRQNYAQDLQTSSCRFGARSQFGCAACA